MGMLFLQKVVKRSTESEVLGIKKPFILKGFSLSYRLILDEVQKQVYLVFQFLTGCNEV